MYDQDLLKKIVQDPPTDRPIVWGSPPNHTGGILVVGEAPGKNEEREGEPFVGDAGKLLRSLIAEALGLPTEAVGDAAHFSNAVLWRPAQGSGPDTPPTTKDIAKCRAHLFLTVAMYRPRAILAVGAVAALALL